MFRLPKPHEKLWKHELIDKKINIFWDGDNVFYPCQVIGYNEIDDKHIVLYENDDTGEKYEEDLNSNAWEIWDVTIENTANSVVRMNFYKRFVHSEFTLVFVG